MERLSSETGITIYLGSKCNLGCSYCHRQATAESGLDEDFLKTLKGYKFIRFIGGEPTLYFDEIKKTVKAAPQADFGIATNGVELEKYLPFFKKHNFHVTVSYDGADDMRAFDPFTGPLNYPRLAVSCTLYHGNCDFKKILKAFAEKEKIIGRPLTFFPHIAHVTVTKDTSFALTDEDFDFIFLQYREFLTKFVNEYEERGLIEKKTLGLVTQLLMAVKRRYAFGETYCVNRQRKKADASGRSFPCLYLREPELHDWQNEQAIYIEEHFSMCRNCAVYSMCGAACIKSVDHEKECRFYKRLYSFFKDLYETHKMTFMRLENKNAPLCVPQHGGAGA